ncbi:MAG: hypothetical protein D6803_08135 [Anaerolineae bacterium]|nr:MAG: hypothetical protein D6803_08135 [Anaerolineae bacterium]
MRVAGDTLYLGDADRGLWALSLADPAHPAWEGDRVELAASARDLVAAGERIYISAFSSYGLQILDRGLNTLGVYRTLYHPYNVIWQGDLAYVFDRGVGLQVVSTTGVPAVIGTAEFEAPYGHLRLALDGGTAFAAANDLQNGRALLYAVDVSDPAAPAVAARTETPFIQSLAAADGYLYAAACEQGVLIYNAGLALLGELPSQGCSDSLLVDGNYLYLGDGAGGLAVFDLGDPAQPREIARHPWPFELPLRPVMVAADGVLYVAYDASAVGRDLPSLLVFDTSILAEITPAGSLTEPRMRAAAVQVENGRLYVADQNGWLYVFDLSNPLSPSLTAKNQSSGGEFYDLAVQGSRFLVTAGGGGMYLYEASHE